ncbi:MAG TPA: clostripain-related cysteine peptidase [bacterium]|nr:clostripain-related cysteine peptidase [bacterium]HOL47941.1 clostripain-related cysteine peptidase [bacterium]HPQ19034.1 clostripain-related cysteine peptidase [bacterium]
MRKIILLFFVFFSVNFIYLFAVPASPKKIKLVQPDKTIIEAYQKGDENYRRIISSDGYTLKKDKDGWWRYAVKEGSPIALNITEQTTDGLVPSQFIYASINPAQYNIPKKLKPQKKFNKPKKIKRTRIKKTKREVYESYTIKLMVLPIQFNDKEAQTELSEYENLLDRLNDYISKQSNGIVNIEWEMLTQNNGWITIDESYEYFGSDSDSIDDANGDIYELARIAIEKAKDENYDVNFSDFDGDEDGELDAVLIIHAGAGQEETGVDTDIWSHYWEIENDPPNIDGVEVTKYMMLAENSPLGVYCFNFLGNLGAPPLYDADYDNVPVGDWCVMAEGIWLNDGHTPAGVCAFLKMDIDPINDAEYNGWIEPIELDSNVLQAVEIVKATAETNEKKLYKINISEKEYFLIEYRVKEEGTYDEFLPDSGIVIYHIDENMPDNMEWGNFVFNDGPPNNSFYRCWVESSFAPNYEDREPDENGEFKYPKYAFNSYENRLNEFSYRTIPNTNTNTDEWTGLSINRIGITGLGDTTIFYVGVQPEIKYQYNILSDNYNNNGIPEANEECYIEIFVKNIAEYSIARELKCSIFINDPYAFVTNYYDTQANFGDINYNSISSGTFSFNISNTCPEDRNINIQLFFTDKYGFNYFDSFYLLVNPSQSTLISEISKAKEITAKEIYKSEKDIEVMSINFPNLITTAQLSEFSVKNNGSITNEGISEIKVWRDKNSNNEFDKSDEYLFSLSYNTSKNYWTATNLNYQIFKNDTLIITISLTEEVNINDTFQCAIPEESIRFNNYNYGPYAEVKNNYYHTVIENKKYVWLLYVAGDNNLAANALNDLIEMKLVGSNENVTFVTLFDSGVASIYEILNDDLISIPLNKVNADWSAEELNMADSNVLAEWIKWCLNYYKADKYILTLWNHGGGWRNIEKGKNIKRKIGREICSDEDADEDNQYMNMISLRSAFENINSEYPDFKFDVIAIDACLEGIIEYAYELKDFANYYIASYTTVDEDGWEYDQVMGNLKEYPDMTIQQFGELAINEFKKRYALSDNNDSNATIAFVNLTKIEEVGNYLSEMCDLFLSENGDSYWAQLYLAIEGADFLAISPDLGECIDLYTLLERIENTLEQTEIKNYAKSAKEKLSEAIESYFVNTYHQNARGLGIYFPVLTGYDDYYEIADPNWSANVSWAQLISTFFSTEDKKDIIAPQPNKITDLPTYSKTGDYTITFDNSADDDNSIKTIILEELTNGKILFEDTCDSNGINTDLWMVNEPSTWKQISEIAYSGSAYFTDSAFTLADMSLTTKNSISIDNNATLEFKIYLAGIENNYDFLFVEVSKDNFKTYERLKRFTGQNEAWTKWSFDLSHYKDQKIKLRFRYFTDNGNLGSGAIIDDIRIYSYSQQIVYRDFEPTGINELTFEDKGNDTYIYRTTAMDAAGNKGYYSDIKIIIVENTATIKITYPENNSYFSDSIITISGTTENTENGDTIYIYVNSELNTIIPIIEENQNFSGTVKINGIGDSVVVALAYNNSYNFAYDTITVNYIYKKIEEYSNGETTTYITVSKFCDINVQLKIYYNLIESNFIIPAEALNNDFDTLIIKEKINNPAFPGSKIIGNIIEIKLQSGQETFAANKKMKFTFIVPAEEIKDEKYITVKYSKTLSTNYNDWQDVEYYPLDISEVDAKNKKIYFEVDHLTYFGIFNNAPQNNLNNLRVYPNPYVPNSNSNEGRIYQQGVSYSGIIFDNLTETSKVYIYSITGELVYNSELANSNIIYWDAKNNSGFDVASGIYIYVVKDERGNTKSGKLAIIR